MARLCGIFWTDLINFSISHHPLPLARGLRQDYKSKEGQRPGEETGLSSGSSHPQALALGPGRPSKGVSLRPGHLIPLCDFPWGVRVVGGGGHIPSSDQGSHFLLPLSPCGWRTVHSSLSCALATQPHMWVAARSCKPPGPREEQTINHKALSASQLLAFPGPTAVTGHLVRSWHNPGEPLGFP